MSYDVTTGADPLSSAGANPLGSMPGAAPPPHAPPPPPPSAGTTSGGLPGQPGQSVADIVRQTEALYRDLLSRPPYSTDPVLAHQVWSA